MDSHDKNTGYTAKDVRDFLKQHESKISHAVVIHTDVELASLKLGELDKDTKQRIESTITKFINMLSGCLYKEVPRNKRKKHLFSICSIEEKGGKKGFTVHANFGLGNIQIDIEELKRAIEKYWIKAGCMSIISEYSGRPQTLSDSHLFVKEIKEGEWVSYKTKEGVGSWSVQNTWLETPKAINKSN